MSMPARGLLLAKVFKACRMIQVSRLLKIEYLKI